MTGYKYDILVIGGGPAGSCAAKKAAHAGCKVLLVERKKEIGEPVRCAEFIPAQLIGELDIPKTYIIQRVKTMKTMLPDNSMVETPAPGFIINRALFDQALALKAEEAGAEIWRQTRALSLNDGNVLVQKNRKNLTINARVIIGADGPHTKVGRWISSLNMNLIPAIQARVTLAEPSDTTEIYFDKRYFGGYGWLFPKGDVANVGLGIRHRRNLNDLRKNLDYFLQRLKSQNKITGKVTGYNAGWIPAEAPRKIVKSNIMLVGDAAGQTHPITGAGVAQAVICGHMAGEHAAEAIKKGDPGILKRYEEAWMDLYGESQQRAYKKRELMENRWDDLDKVIKKCWVAFKEYYQDGNP